MRKKIISFVTAWLIILPGFLLAQDFTWEDISGGNLNVRVILVNPEDSGIIFAGSGGSVLKSEDAGKTWRRVLSIRGGLKNINALMFAPSNLNFIYAGTDNGLYLSKDLGERWERVFRGKNNKENQCIAVLAAPYAVFVGTRAGLFISNDSCRHWRKDNGEINNSVIFNIDFNPSLSKVVYLAAACGIFKSLDNGESWKRVFVSYLKEDNQQGDVDIDKTDEERGLSDIHFVKSDINDVNCVYFSSIKGVYRSQDQAKTWNKLGEYGLLDRDVKMFCLSVDSGIFGLSQSGVFLYQNDRWNEVSFDLAAGKLNYLALDSKGDIYAAGEKGVFKSSRKSSTAILGQIIVQEYFKYEPKITDVQKAAIEYAEVSPEKIAQWRRKAAKKALLPQVSIGLDRNSTDLWHWETGSSTKNDDDILRHGQDSIDWDVGLSWDLSDLIWNEAQTSIDVRSKLMVELRDDILDQVNKLYFERIRVKSELDNLAIEDRNKRFDKQLKLEELTASLDSLTAGYYSDQLQLINKGRF
ncbi:MAG: hypothetical protein WC731_02685 [Candidatus Omnitrophota bacterium]|jgi:photosystem II stability/assembly factor-like uncharacterized protein